MVSFGTADKGKNSSCTGGFLGCRLAAVTPTQRGLGVSNAHLEQVFMTWPSSADAGFFRKTRSSALEVCLQVGEIVPAEVVDHRKPISKEGREKRIAAEARFPAGGLGGYVVFEGRVN